MGPPDDGILIFLLAVLSIIKISVSFAWYVVRVYDELLGAKDVFSSAACIFSL